MSLAPLLVNDWFPTALFGVACYVILAAVGFSGFTEGNDFGLAIPLLFFDVFFFALPSG